MAYDHVTAYIPTKDNCKRDYSQSATKSLQFHEKKFFQSFQTKYVLGRLKT